jgi:hypothetical protein
MNKLFLIIIVVIVAILGGIAIASYILHLPPAVAITDTIKTKLDSINIGGHDITEIGNYISIAGLATTALGWLNSNKEKDAATSFAKTQIANNQQLEGKLKEIDEKKKELEETLTTKIADVTTLKDNALTELESVRDELTTTKQQLETATTQCDAWQNINSDTIMDLWQKSGGDFWTDPITGEKYKLMNLERVIVR